MSNARIPDRDGFSEPFGEAANSPDDGPRKGPGIGQFFLWGMLGCGSLVILFCGVAGIGGFAWYKMEKAPAANPVVVNRDQPTWEDDPANLPAGQLPEPPLKLAAPPPPSSTYEETDLAEFEPQALRALAHRFHLQGQYQAAVQFQHHSVLKDQIGKYLLACYCSRAGDVPAAQYWLQECAQDEGVDVLRASGSSDLRAVRNDLQWPKLWRYLRGYEHHWETSGYSETSLVLPQNALPGSPLPVFVGLHTYGGNAHEFVNTEDHQALADSLGAAFLGVSGTRCHGKNCFVWSDYAAKDLARVDAALNEVADRLTPAQGQIVLFGYLHGATVAGELAARDPQRFAGAILLSPISILDVNLLKLPQFPAGRRPALVAVCGVGEDPTEETFAKQYADAYRSQLARVHLKIDPGRNVYAFPPDFSEKFPFWGKFILDPAAQVPD